MDINILLNKTLTEILSYDDELHFITSEGEKYRMYHYQDCCEDVWLEDVAGGLEDLIGSPLTMAEEVVQDGTDDDDCSESRTWTFYKLATIKGYVTLRWCGESNGYYSESVDFEKID